MPSKGHGGVKGKGKRKIARPLATKRKLHVCAKSSRATQDWSFVKHRRKIEEQIKASARRFNIRIHRRQVMSNHFHLIIQGRKRWEIQNFLRHLPGAVAMLVTNTAKTRPIGGFWDAPLFTRIIEWGRDLWNMENYIEKNRLEADGVPRDIVDAWFKETFG